MFEYMGDRLSNAIKNIKGMGRITEDNISDAMREIRMALLEADVNYEVVKEFVRNVKEKALGLEVEKSLKPEELFIKLVKDELVALLGGDFVPLETSKNPTIIMMTGLQGSGKTTTSGKIANLVRKKNKKKMTCAKNESTQNRWQEADTDSKCPKEQTFLPIVKRFFKRFSRFRNLADD